MKLPSAEQLYGELGTNLLKAEVEETAEQCSREEACGKAIAQLPVGAAVLDEQTIPVEPLTFNIVSYIGEECSN